MEPLNIKTCRVCGSALKGTLCPDCGWTLVIYPESAPQDLILQEKQREEIMTQRVKEFQGLKSLAEKSARQSGQSGRLSMPVTSETIPISAAPAAEPQQYKEPQAVQMPLGMVLISDTASDRRQGLPIYYGTNTYGTKCSAISYNDIYSHQITLFSRSGAFETEHFSVVAGNSNKAPIIMSLGNRSITNKGHEFSEKKCEPSDRITICKGNELFNIEILMF